MQTDVNKSKNKRQLSSKQQFKKHKRARNIKQNKNKQSTKQTSQKHSSNTKNKQGKRGNISSNPNPNPNLDPDPETSPSDPFGRHGRRICAGLATSDFWQQC